MVKNKMLPVADAYQRNQAPDPTQSYIVQAPAGSGKTELLIQRYLALLSRVESPEEIIAITFTRKAAAEMRGRLLKALDAGYNDPKPDTEFQLKTWELARCVIEADTRFDWDLQQNPSRLRIQTVDALCARLTKQMPLLSRFGAQPEIVENADLLYREAVEETLKELETGEDWSTSIEILLRHLDNDLVKIKGLLIDMLACRDQWLRHLVGQDRVQQRNVFELGLHRLICDELQILAQKIPKELQESWLSLARFASMNIIDNGNPADIIHCLDLDAFPTSDPENIDVWRGLVALVLTRNGDWRSRLTISIGFPASNSKEKQALTDLISRLKDQGLRKYLHAIRVLPPPCYSDQQWTLMQALFDLLPLVVAQLRLVFQQHGVVDFTEIMHQALASLGDDNNPTDLALALDYRIRHILIDEFQDTNLSQVTLLKRLTGGWERGDGRTLFVVGDPMQSIYRFREAEVGLFLQARHDGLGDVYLNSLALSVNFRSQHGIVDWVNSAFEQIFPSQEDIVLGAVPYARSSAFYTTLPGNAVRIHPMYEKDDKNEAQVIVDIIKEARRANPQENIAILVRSRTHLIEIVPALKVSGIAFQAIEIESLANGVLVQDLLALSKALNHLGDRIAWLAVLRAPWCGLSLSDLHTLSASSLGVTIWALLQSNTLSLSDDGKKRLVRMREILESCFRHRGRNRVRRTVESAWLALGGPACAMSKAELEDADIFFELLDRFDAGGGLSDFAALDKAVNELYAPPDVKADNSLQIMTIHKAKGLEFDTVIIPGLGKKSKGSRKRLLHWLERSRGCVTDLLVAPIAGIGQKPDAIYSAIQSIDRSKADYEATRLLYVAATRAKNHLHLLGHVDLDSKSGRPCLPQKNSLLATLWPAVEGEFVDKSGARMSLEHTESYMVGFNSQEIVGSRIRRLCSNWECPLPPPDIDWKPAEKTIQSDQLPSASLVFDWAGAKARSIGIVTHQMLEKIACESIDCWNSERLRSMRTYFAARLSQLGISNDELKSAINQIERIILSTLADKRGRWILSSGHLDSRTEFPLTGLFEGMVIDIVIDRTFISEDGTRWIIDYKTGTHEGADLENFLDIEQSRYRAQLERYAVLMSTFEPRPIRLGLYFPSICGWREWQFNQGAINKLSRIHCIIA